MYKHIIQTISKQMNNMNIYNRKNHNFKINSNQKRNIRHNTRLKYIKNTQKNNIQVYNNNNNTSSSSSSSWKNKKNQKNLHIIARKITFLLVKVIKI